MDIVINILQTVWNGLFNYPITIFGITFTFANVLFFVILLEILYIFVNGIFHRE